MSETISKLSLPPLTHLLITDLESLKTHSDTGDRKWKRSKPKIGLPVRIETNAEYADHMERAARCAAVGRAAVLIAQRRPS
jgi:hypothetical protein